MDPHELLLAYQRQERDFEDVELDAALGLPPQRWTPDAQRDTKHQTAHPGESIVNVATPYEVCRNFVDALSLSADDLVVDLGCGMGRLLLYAAIATPARFRGIELIGTRVAVTQRCVAELGLEGRVSVIEGNVLNQTFDDATVFYMFRPFSVETEAEVFARLNEQALRRTIRVVTHRLQPSLFDREIFDCVSLATPQVHRSRPRPQP